MNMRNRKKGTGNRTCVKCHVSFVLSAINLSSFDGIIFVGTNLCKGAFHGNRK